MAVATKVIHLTEDIDGWSEPKAKLRKIQARLKEYYGKQVILWGGGGWGGSTATLERVTLHPTILKNHDGYTLKAHLKDISPLVSDYVKADKWTPWLGSWQLSVKV